MSLYFRLFLIGIGVGLLFSFGFKDLFNFLKNKLKNKEKVNIDINDDSYDYVYIHEAGHAFLAYLFCDEYLVEAYTSKNTSPCVTYSKEVRTKLDVINLILICYAGAAAEEVILGKFSAGSIISNKYNDSDFVKCVDYLKTYILLEENSSSFPYELRHSKTMLDRDFNDLVVEKSKTFYDKTIEIVKQNKKVIIELADLIKKKKRLSKDEIDNFFPEPKEWYRKDIDLLLNENNLKGENNGP